MALAAALLTPLASGAPKPTPVPKPSAIDAAHALQTTLNELAQRARPGELGISVLNLQTGASWWVNANREYPMMSVFKAPLGATVLAQIDAGILSYDQRVNIRRTDLRSGASEIRDQFTGDAMTFSVRQLLTLAVSKSDNTAADALGATHRRARRDY